MKNIPVDVVQKMGVDYLIVVNIGTPLSKKSKIKSVLDVMSQVGRFGGRCKTTFNFPLWGKTIF
jgi:hypothetical protein